MRKVDFAIIGGGPAGLSAAHKAAEAGLSSLIIERDEKIGGQLVKQTHMFFGSKKQYAKTRGIDIADILIGHCSQYEHMIEIMTNTTVTGLYDDYVLSVLQGDQYKKISAKVILIATGASEKFMLFENNDLPGIYGAGAVQTLMNVYGVLPGQDVVMVGSGNIGLIVSYQLLQAGVNVKMVIEAADQIGGYKVHASKIKRLGVDILTNYTIKRAIGKETLEKVEIVSVDHNWKQVKGTEKVITCDALCISVGLSPLTTILGMLPIDMKYVSALGGNVPVIDHNHETTMKNIFVAGDVCGVEEASSAIVEGAIVGLLIAKRLGYAHPNYQYELDDLRQQLAHLRSGPFGQKTINGLRELRGDADVG